MKMKGERFSENHYHRRVEGCSEDHTYPWERGQSKRLEWGVWVQYLRCEFERRIMFSRNVFWGATSPLRPPGIVDHWRGGGMESSRAEGSVPVSG